jgi:hypothetical protein
MVVTSSIWRKAADRLTSSKDILAQRAPSAPFWGIIRLAILFVSILTGLAVALNSIHIAFRDMYVFPYWDMMAVHHIYFLAPLRDFFIFRDNEHLPIAAMSLFLADSEIFHAQGVSLIAGILVLNALLVALTADEYRRHAPRSTIDLMMVSAIFAANMFWLIHRENLIWPKQIHMYLSAATTLLAFRFLVSVEDHHADHVMYRRGKLFAACVLMTIATFSFAYGAVAWLAAIMLAVARRWPAQLVGSLFAAFLVNMSVYAAFYNVATLEHHTNPFLALLRPLHVAEYLVHYLSAPITVLLQQAFAQRLAETLSLGVSALACILAVAGILYVGLVGKREANRLAQFSCLLLLFTIGAGMMTALSRLDFGADQSQASRYAIIQVLFWNGLILLFAALYGQWKRLQSIFLSANALFVCALLIPSQIHIARSSREQAEEHWTAVLAIINGVDDKQILTTKIFPAPDVIKSVTQGLAVRGWSIFAHPQPWWVGRPASALFREGKAERCRGYFDASSNLERLTDGAYVNGWAWDEKARSAPEWVVLLDDDSVVRSLGRSGLLRDDVAQALPETAGSRPGWRGYVASKAPISELHAYAVLSDGATICPLRPYADAPSN